MRRDTTRQGQKKGQGQRARVRLGAGEFVPATGVNPHAQMRYLVAVSRCVPEAFSELVALASDDDAGIEAWATRRGFTDAWARRNAIGNADLWREQPDMTGRWVILTPSAQWVPMALWESNRESLPAFTARMKPLIKRTPEKHDDRHFEWLALHCVGHQTYTQIVERYQNQDGSPDVSAVSRAITETAALTGVTLPPARGRRKLSR